MDNLIIKTLPVGQMQSNCYLLIDISTKDCLIIDPGDDADYIERIIADEKTVPTKIIATHGHFDHIMATHEIQLAYKIPFLIHKKDEFLVSKMQNNAKFFLNIDAGPPPKIDGNLKDRDKIKIGNWELEVIETPGHTPGSLCLYSKQQNIMLTGDTIFAGGGVGRTDFSYSSKSDLETSIKKILKLPSKTIIYPGHGEYSTLKDEINFHDDLIY